MHALSNFVWIRGIKKARRYALGFLFGRDGEIRTHDPLHPMQVRYRAALHPDFLALVAQQNPGE
jgi:hypothetical protein